MPAELCITIHSGVYCLLQTLFIARKTIPLENPQQRNNPLVQVISQAAPQETRVPEKLGYFSRHQSVFIRTCNSPVWSQTSCFPSDSASPSASPAYDIPLNRKALDLRLSPLFYFFTCLSYNALYTLYFYTRVTLNV